LGAGAIDEHFVLGDFDAFDGDAGLFADEAREECAGVGGAEPDAVGGSEGMAVAS